MPSLFTRIINGEIPGRFVWRDETAVAFLDVRPLAAGHCLVVPVAEVDRWTDLPETLAAHCMRVAHAVANAQQLVFSPLRVGLMIAGFEVPHVHLHVFPSHGMASFDFAQADTSPDAAMLDAQMVAIRAALRAAGHEASVPGA